MSIRLNVQIALMVATLTSLPVVILATTGAETCAMQQPNASWIKMALADWEQIRRADLHVDAAPLPRLILFDTSCTWKLEADSGIEGAPHDGRIVVPDGSTIDAQVTSFTGTYSADDRPFIVMALPDVWRRDPNTGAKPNLDRLTRSVFVHEMTHTLQAHTTGIQLTSMESRFKLPANLTDDIIQEHFGGRPGFRDAYEAERDLLYRAAAESNSARRRMLAVSAYDAMKKRRAEYFVGADAVYEGLEDLFLGMEGVANWAGYRLAAREIGNLPDAVTLMRGGGKHWSQDEGLALFLVIDGAVPGWQELLFGPAPPSVGELLAMAVR